MNAKRDTACYGHELIWPDRRGVNISLVWGGQTDYGLGFVVRLFPLDVSIHWLFGYIVIAWWPFSPDEALELLKKEIPHKR